MKSHIITIGNTRIGGHNPVRIMGVINLSPESFYVGSVADDKWVIPDILEKMEKEGADIIDVGAASTAPSNYYGDRAVSVKTEIERVRQYMKIICDNTTLPVSIDTRSPIVAEIALNMGAQLVNDVSGLKDDRMIRLVADRGVPVIIMAECGGPCSSMGQTIEVIGVGIQRAVEGGIDRDKIIVDPGIGFGRPPGVDFAIISHLERFLMFEQPVLIGVSRKAFIGSLLNQPDPADRLEGTIAATAIAVVNGAHMIRAHDVREAKIASMIGEALRRDGDPN